MFFRKIIASVLVFIFVNISVLFFLLFAVENTFFKPDFYTTDLAPDLYEVLVDFTAKSLMENSDTIVRFFSESDLRREIMDVYPEKIFLSTLNSVVDDFEMIKDNPSMPFTLKLGSYRESLLTLAHNLSYSLYKSIPECLEDEFPERTENGLVSCIPTGVDYNEIAAPFSEEFEEAVYSVIPEQIQLDLNSSIGDSGLVLSDWIKVLEQIRLFFYTSLLLILTLIAVIIYKPFSSVIGYIGAGFFSGGFSGMMMGYFLIAVPNLISNAGSAGMNAESVYNGQGITDLLNIIFPKFSDEVNKAAMVFLATGAILLVLKFFVKEHEKGVG